MGVSIQHGFSCLYTVILDKVTRHTKPNAVFKSADLTFGILSQLFGNRLDLSCLNVELAFKDVYRSKRTNSGLSAFNSSEIVNSGLF